MNTGCLKSVAGVLFNRPVYPASGLQLHSNHFPHFLLLLTGAITVRLKSCQVVL